MLLQSSSMLIIDFCPNPEVSNQILLSRTIKYVEVTIQVLILQVGGEVAIMVSERDEIHWILHLNS